MTTKDDISRVGPLQDGGEPAEFETEIEAARAYDHAANEFFKRLDKSKIDLEFGEYGTDISIVEHSDDDEKSLTCTRCGGLVFTTFTFGGDKVERLCWDCFDEILTTMIGGTDDDEWEQIGEVGVDSGQLMVCDPCYIDGEWEKEDYTGDDKPAKHAFRYNAVCHANMNEGGAAQLRYKLGHLGVGVAFSSGIGDGTYPVFAKYADVSGFGRRIAEVKIVMLPYHFDDDEVDDGNTIDSAAVSPSRRTARTERGFNWSSFR